MRNQKGITLVSLVIYMVIFAIILGIMATVSNFFYKNVRTVGDSPKYISEFNKFSMFFIEDVKNNSNVKECTDTSVTFEDDTFYEFKENGIYRNGTQVAKYIKSLTFQESTVKLGKSKKIITVDVSIGNNKETFNDSIDFVLKYW